MCSPDGNVMAHSNTSGLVVLSFRKATAFSSKKTAVSLFDVGEHEGDSLAGVKRINGSSSSTQPCAAVSLFALKPHAKHARAAHTKGFKFAECPIDLDISKW